MTSSNLSENAGRVETKAGTQAALDSLAVAEGPQDMSRLARLAAAKGGKTRAIVKLLGRAAIVLTAGAFDLAIWLLWAAFAAVRLLLLVQGRGRAHDAALSRPAQNAPRAMRSIATSRTPLTVDRIGTKAAESGTAASDEGTRCLDARKALQQAADGDLRFHPRQRHSGTGMNAGAEGEMAVRLAADIETIGIRNWAGSRLAAPMPICT